MVSAPNADVSTMYVAKYNRFVDTILGRINKILKDKYDPVTVKLTNPNTGTKSKKAAGKKTKRRKSAASKKRAGKSRVVAASRIAESVQEPLQNATSTDEASQPITEIPKIEETTLAAMQTASEVTSAAPELATRLVTNEVSVTPSNRGSSGNASGNTSSNTSGKRKKNKTRTSTSKSGTKTKKTSTSGTANKVKAPTKATPTKKNRSKAKATLYGLASLKRSGDVSVNMMSDHTTIRTKFNLGPLVLKVEKEFGRSTRKEVRSATATTAEMSGRLSLRVYHGGAATLHSIRVLQPKQMRIESADDHDRTREFVWKRSSHIAHLVSQKLSSATRSMLRPPPSSSSHAAVAA